MTNGGFDSEGVGYWNRMASDTNWALYTSPAPKDGSYYLEFNAGPQGMTSIWQDVPYPVAAGRNFSASVWTRCWRTDIGYCVLKLAVWALGQDGDTSFNSGYVSVNNDGAWHQVSVSGTFWEYHDKVRLELYSYNAGWNVDMDAASLSTW